MASPQIFIAANKRQEFGRLAQLGVPIALAQLATMLMGFVDTLMLGRYSTDALAAAVTSNAVIFSTIMFANGILFGLDPLIAQAHGSGDGQRAGLATQRGVVLALLLSVPVAAIWMFMGEIFVFFGQAEELAPLAQTYANALIPSVPFFLLQSVMRQFLQGREIVRPGLYITLMANVVNAVANYGLIFGNFGLPELGMYGAGLATTCTRFFSLLALYAWVRGFGLHAGAWPAWSRAAWDPRALWSVVAIGFPVAIQVGTEMWAFNAATLLAGSLGTVTAAAHGVVLSMASISFMAALGIAVGTTTRVGNLIGAGHHAGAQRAARLAMLMGAGVMTISAVGFVVFRESLPLLYLSDPAVVALAASILPIAAAFQIFDGTQAVGCGVLRGMGRTRPAAGFNVIGYWVLGLPLGYWFGIRQGSLAGLWWGLALGLAVVAFLLIFWIQRNGPAAMAPKDGRHAS